MEPNIPPKKIKAKIASIIGSCATCSKRSIVAEDDVLDGLCGGCMLKVKVVNRLVAGNIPILYWDKLMKDFVGDPRLLEKYKELTEDISATYNNGKSILIKGSHGTGKTMTAVNILRFVSMKGFSIWYSTLSDIVASLTNYDQAYEARQWLTTVDVLCIDEFDQRFVASEQSSNLFARSLETIIRTRLANTLPTIMVSNSPNIVETLSGQLKESLSSLFAEVEQFVVLGEDRRKQ